LARTMAAGINEEGESEYFNILKAAIEERTGVLITPDRERALYSLLAQRIKELDCTDIDQYLVDVLHTVSGAQEWSSLVDSLLIKETSFFRHSSSMEFVQHWIDDGLAKKTLTSPIWLWSLGCSTGEEAYSLAIIVEQAMAAAGQELRYGIIGTDISREAIGHARRGIYRESKMAKLDQQIKETYFDQVGQTLWRVKADVRRRVCFLNSNILTDKSPLIRRKMHLIYCQNMLVYFRRWKRREIVNQLSNHLDNQGCLIVGLGELSGWVPNGFARAATRTVQAYIKTDNSEQGEAQ